MQERSGCRAKPVILALLGSLASLVLVALPIEASADASFEYDGVTWRTYQTHGTWYMASSSDTFRIRAGRVTAVFDEALTDAHVEAIVDDITGLSVLRHTRFNTYDFEFSSNTDPGQYAAALGQREGVVTAVPDAFCIVLDAIPDDDEFGDQWAYRNTGQTGGTSDADIDATDAWETETGDTTVLIAVLDTGTVLDHPNLEKSLWTNWDEATGTAGVDDDGNGFVDDVYGYDFHDDDGDPSPPSWDSFHGTHVGGIAVAKTNNDLGVAGLAGGWGSSRSTGCKLMSLRIGVAGVADTISWSAIDDAIEYATDNGADVISMSFHSTASIPGLSRAVNDAWSNGVLLVASSGNRVSGVPDQIHEPASNDKVMAIGATDDIDDVANYSVGGSQINLCAPGGESGSVNDPDFRRILSTVDDDDYGYKSGTSMSTPMAAAAAALARSADSSLTNSELWSVLEFSVDDEAGTASEGWEDDYGWGRLNVATMLEAIDYQQNSYYTYSDSLCKVFCPGADADSFVITVTIEDGQSDPVEDVPAAAIWVESYSPVQFKVCCADEDSPRCYMTYTGRVFADGPTDSLGSTTITFKAGGGSYTNPMRKVRVYGLDLPASGVPWQLATFRSFDLTKDCVVDDSDLAAFHTMRGKNNMAADFDCDNDVDAADSLLLAAHYGHACPGSRSGRAATGHEFASAELRQNNPNPFNPATRIEYQIHQDGAQVRVAVYNISGRLIRTLVDRLEDQGSHWVSWDGKDDHGREVSSGVYFYRIETPGFSEQRKMVLLR